MPILPCGVARADRVAAHPFRRRRGHCAERFYADVPEGTGVDPGGLFHEDQRHGLHEVVLHHVFHGPCTVVIRGPALERQALQPADVHALDVRRVPDRLEDPVEEPEGDHPADKLAGQEVIDPEDRRLGQPEVQDLVQVPG